MNCFVIMPFSIEFDDVYESIKTTVQDLLPSAAGRCFRLDENRPAGRITDRLPKELEAANLCIADLTGTLPNVMWEVGYAMALRKPTLFVTQDLSAQPFDIKDMMTIEYSRTRLSQTLSLPLRRSLIDTIGDLDRSPTQQAQPRTADSTLVGELLSEMAQLKNMVAEAVSAWKVEPTFRVSAADSLQGLVGHWIDQDSATNMYSRILHGELVSPYGYGGSNMATGVQYGWRRTGDYWFSRYKALRTQIMGFSFLKFTTVDELSGAWWAAGFELAEASEPPSRAGVPARWIRDRQSSVPRWAEDFFARVESEGLASIISTGSAAH